MAALLPKSEDEPPNEEEEDDDPANNVVDEEEAEPKALEAGVGEVGDASPSALELELDAEDETEEAKLNELAAILGSGSSERLPDLFLSAMLYCNCRASKVTLRVTDEQKPSRTSRR